MKHWIAVSALFISIPGLAYKNYSADHPVHVEGYNRSDGTHVESYYRSRPGEADNYSSGLNSSYAHRPRESSSSFGDDYNNSDPDSSNYNQLNN